MREILKRVGAHLVHICCGCAPVKSLRRPLSGRSHCANLQALTPSHLTLRQFPHWLHTRKGLRWMPLSYPTHDEMETAEVSVSNIVIALLKFWFPSEIGTHSWENGVLLRHEGREPVLLRMRMGPMPQDADAFKHVFSLKGSSGQSPCPWCKNCMHRLPFFRG